MLMVVGELTEVSALVTTQVKQWFETDTKKFVDTTAPDNILVHGRLENGAVGQLSLPASARGLERHYRVGPSVRAYDDRSYVHFTETSMAVGLRPYRPAHFVARRRDDLAIELSWTRRTRVDGDSWLGRDVPLGEESEAYLLRVRNGSTLLREVEASRPEYVYSAAEQAEDGSWPAISFEVAQMSVRFGPGPFERIEFDG